ncbi:hypothetical protein ODJ79_32840 [Actinoplanes sp. KI2]|uniref:hypothetical protein n=1 Tax=Actinoplanes sp. KI2 TaxID=2983315 RepID=UPI0021D5C2C9|nr:hypothetical protein [Actinoplanes sp. KI2]MCU7728524.1 hypothetical protein [Actinoplanes sp. KI2]
MLCRDIFQDGCDRPVGERRWGFGPCEWIHDNEWYAEGRPSLPTLRPDLAGDLLRQLAEQGNATVRRMVAEHPGTPPEVVDALTDDPESEVRMWALWHTRTVALLRAGLRGEDRKGAAHNPLCPPHLLAEWRTDPDPSTRYAVLTNPATPAWVVDAAVNDPDDSNRAYAAASARSRDSILQAATSPETVLRRRAAVNPACPPDVLERLATDPDSHVRSALGLNQVCPPDLIRRLATDDDADVRRTVAGRPDPPDDIRAMLSRDPHPQVREWSRDPYRR